MTTFFQTIPRSFENVPVTADNKIKTVEFLEASTGIVMLFDKIGSAALGTIKSDVTGNINKLKAKLSEIGESNGGTLQDLVSYEKARPKEKNTGTEALLWLKRGLEFTCTALKFSVENEKEEMSVAFNSAYDATLKKHHSFMVRPVVALAMKAVPSKSDFYSKLGDDQSTVVAQMKPWLKSLDDRISIINKFYEDQGMSI